MKGVVISVVDRAQQVLDEDYEELLERLRVADFLYTEYSLEEVIYQLAKVMFSQSLNRGQHHTTKRSSVSQAKINGGASSFCSLVQGTTTKE
jgi:hypothetical protein